MMKIIIFKKFKLCQSYKFKISGRNKLLCQVKFCLGSREKKKITEDTQCYCRKDRGWVEEKQKKMLSIIYMYSSRETDFQKV